MRKSRGAPWGLLWGFRRIDKINRNPFQNGSDWSVSFQLEVKKRIEGFGDHIHRVLRYWVIVLNITGNYNDITFPFDSFEINSIFFEFIKNEASFFQVKKKTEWWSHFCLTSSMIISLEFFLSDGVRSHFFPTYISKIWFDKRKLSWMWNTSYRCMS